MRRSLWLGLICLLGLSLIGCDSEPGEAEGNAPINGAAGTTSGAGATTGGAGGAGGASGAAGANGGAAGTVSGAGGTAGTSGGAGGEAGAMPTAGTSASGDATSWTHLGYDASNTYHNPHERTLSVDNASTIVKKWEFTTDGVPHGGLSIAAGKVFATTTGSTYAINLADGTEAWKVPLSAESTAAYADGAVYVHTVQANLYKLDAETGATVWGPIKTYNLPGSDGTSSPVVGGGKVIVGHSAGVTNEIGSQQAAASSFGGVEAFDIETGERAWTYETCAGSENGAMVWSTVSIDLEANVVFAATGNNYTVVGENSDSIHAINLATGERLWKTQVRAGDQWSLATGGSQDTDFGANPILATIGTRKVVAAGDKASAFWVLDRVTGEIVWSKENLSSSHNPSNGGVLNNGAYDGQHFFFVSNEPPSKSVLHAVNAADGSALWPVKRYNKIVWGMPTLANGLLVVPVNNELHIYNAATGDMLNTFDTVGTIAAGAPTIADGMIVVKSGMQYIFAGFDATFGTKVFAYGLP